MKSKEELEIILDALSKTKAENIVYIDVSKLTSVADFFVIASASSTTAVKAFSDACEEMSKTAGIELIRRDGYNESKWIVLDFGNIIVHILTDEARELFNLEKLWSSKKNYYIYSKKEETQKKETVLKTVKSKAENMKKTSTKSKMDKASKPSVIKSEVKKVNKKKKAKNNGK